MVAIQYHTDQTLASFLRTFLSSDDLSFGFMLYVLLPKLMVWSQIASAMLSLHIGQLAEECGQQGHMHCGVFGHTSSIHIALPLGHVGLLLSVTASEISVLNVAN